MRVALYRLFDDRQPPELLYVGITYNPTERLADHRYKKEWWPEVGRVAIEWFESREEAREAELAAIRSEFPTFNVADQLPDDIIDGVLERERAGAVA